MEDKDLLNFFYEAGALKNTLRSGWLMIGNKNPESVAEHSFRTAIIGYFLAKKENADPDKVMRMCLFHDFHETRTGDLNKLNQRYIAPKDAEEKSFSEIIKNFDETEKNELSELHSEFGSSSDEGVVSKDADYIECALQAKEYTEQGYEKAWDWINNISKVVRTDSAKKLIDDIRNSDSGDWWKGLKKIN